MSIVKALKGKRGEHVLRILHAKLGDKEITWDPNDYNSVCVAEQEFQEAIQAGLRGFDSGPNGERAGVKEFDPEAEVVVVAPQINGG